MAAVQIAAMLRMDSCARRLERAAVRLVVLSAVMADASALKFAMMATCFRGMGARVRAFWSVDIFVLVVPWTRPMHARLLVEMARRLDLRSAMMVTQTMVTVATANVS